MTKRFFFLAILFWLLNIANAYAQHSVTFEVRDSITQDPIPGVIVVAVTTLHGTATDIDGIGNIQNLAAGNYTFSFSLTGYAPYSKMFSIPRADSTKTILIRLQPTAHSMDEVVVSSTRTNSRIDDLPTKVEVLGQEDLNEENGIKPGNVGSLLGDLSVIHIQQVSPTSGGSVVRMQGLDGRYTQLLRDGLPLYDGFSGNLGILQLPPLDLRQIEIVKGPASVLFGGGAIGGMINFISREPSDSAELSITANQSTLMESNLNLFASRRAGKMGVTVFAGQTFQQAIDVNRDGFSDVPEVRSTVFHPRLFFYPGKNTKADIGWNILYDDRNGGDIQAIRFGADSIHPYIENNNTLRNTFDAHFTHSFDEHFMLQGKTAWSFSRRDYILAGFHFSGEQRAAYNELAVSFLSGKHEAVIGANLLFNGISNFIPGTISLVPYSFITLGGFISDRWKLSKHVTVEPGFRYDHHQRYGNFYLPALALLIKPSPAWTIRAGAGTGYKVPDAFEYSNGQQLATLAPVAASVKPETSFGANADVAWRHAWENGLSIQLDEAIYYTKIESMIGAVEGPNFTEVKNTGHEVQAYGTDSYLRMRYQQVELYIGFNHTISTNDSAGVSKPLAFAPNNKIAATLAYEIEKKWRFGIESSFVATQYDEEADATRNYWFLAAMISRTFGNTSFVLNAENLLDERQSRYMPLYTGTLANPSFKPLFMPIDGRVVNFSVRIKF